MLEALLHGSTVASCSSKMIASCRTSIRTEPPRSFLSPGTAKVPRVHCCLVATKAAYRGPVCSQALVSLPKPEPVYSQGLESLPNQKPLIKQINVDSYKNSSSYDFWLEDCICDIVKHIHEAPFLQLLFDSKDNSVSQRQRVPAGDLSADESWKEMKNHVSKSSPDGLILVHQLPDSSVMSCVKEDTLAIDAKRSRDACNGGTERTNNDKDLWGILVLGKTIACNACYILETTSVASSFGTCTRFCLTKAQSFGPSWHDQIQSSWLLKTDVQQY